MADQRTHNLDVWLGDARLEHGARVPVRVDGADVGDARVGWLGGGFHQLRCEARPERVARGTSVEAGGAAGRVLDPDAPRHGPSNDLLVALTRLRDAGPG